MRRLEGIFGGGLPLLRRLGSVRRIDWERFGGKDDWSNVAGRVESEWLPRQLLATPDHPLSRTVQRVVRQMQMEHFDSQEPIVSTHDNFDALLIPKDHVSRSPTDTYYVNRNYVLRTHTTAHQRRLLLQGPPSWLVSGDVYRRDAVDATHFPVFHQIDGGRVFPQGVSEREAELDLKKTLEDMIRALFGADVQMRWRDDYFPFTVPSWELDVWFNNEWMEVLGSGLIHPQIMESVGLANRRGWAFGMGIERLAMVLYGVRDIRTFWSKDPRFMQQFAGLPLDAKIQYQEYSKFPKSSRDVSFWLQEGVPFHENAFFELVREVAGDLVETVHVVDQFVHPKTGRTSFAFRIDYRSMDRTLESEEVNHLQSRVRDLCSSQLGVILR